MEEEKRSKWEGKASCKVRSMSAEQVWPLFEDFCSFHKWLPSIDTCYKLEGDEGQPGLIRCCKSTIPSPPPPPPPPPLDDHQPLPSSTIKWCHEELVSIDPLHRCLTYRVQENNMGITSYVATFQVNDLVDVDDDDDGEGAAGCEIVWSFGSDPIDGLTVEDFSCYIEASLQAMAKRMEQAQRTSTN